MKSRTGLRRAFFFVGRHRGKPSSLLATSPGALPKAPAGAPMTKTKGRTGAAFGRLGGRLSGVNKLRRKLKKHTTFQTLAKVPKKKAARRRATTAEAPVSAAAASIMELAEKIADELGLTPGGRKV